MYPTISEYIESIGCAEDNFATLTNLRPVLDGDGHPVMSVGNFAVVFKMQDAKTKKHYALKCFIKDQPERAESYRLIADELEFVSSDYLVHVRYLEKELFVDSTARSETEFPVLLMDWVDGVTLDKWVKQHISCQYSLQLITYQFCRMASWLMSQPFAHGDLKPDNIIVREDGTLVLVDYDGMYVPAMQGKKARELGSPDYRHPARNADDFNEHIDDFSLAAIAMQLAAIALDPGLFANQDGDTLLLTERDHRDLANSSNHNRLHSLFHNADFERLYALYLLAHAQQTLGNVSFRAFYIPKPEKRHEPIELSTEVTDEDIKNGVKDEFGALYSPDGIRLLKGVNIEQYQIRQGTKVICDEAFAEFKYLSSITIPDSVTLIGDEAFSRCESLSFITIPNSVTHIGDRAFYWCNNLSSITIPDSVTHIGDWAFQGCKSLSSISIADAVTHIGDWAFSGCYSLFSITIPNSVTHLGTNPFANSAVHDINCYSKYFEVDEDALYSKGKKMIIAFFNRDASEFTIPDSVTNIGDRAFSGCNSLSSITIPGSVTHIGNSAFLGCKRLSSIIIPNSVTHIGDSAFWWCERLSSVTIPNSVTHIGDSAFWGCRSLSSITIPDSVTLIGDEAFSDCVCLSSISIPNSVTHIGDCAFLDCYSLTSISIPDSVTHIGDSAFGGCESLSSITIPNSVKLIGFCTFSDCKSLSSISIPNSVTHIEDCAFYGCDSLSSIIIPKGSRAKFEQMLPDDLHDKLVEQ